VSPDGLKFTYLRPHCLLIAHGSKDSIREMLNLGSSQDEIEHLAAIAGPRAFNLSETDWLLVEHSLQDTRRRFLAGEGRRSQVQLVDVTGSWASVLIEGHRARAALAATTNAPQLLKGVQPQQYIGVRLEAIEVIVQCVHAQGFQLYAERKSVSYLQKWICAADQGRAMTPPNMRMN